MKLHKIIIAFVFLFICVTAKIHAQQVGFTYQAVAIDESKAQGFGRDSHGEILVNKSISLRFSIREGTEEGEVKYQEIHHTSTDIFGIFRLVIGRGLNITGTPLKDLQWGIIPYFLQVEIDLGHGFEFMGIEELLGVPYALNTGKQLLSLNQNVLSISNGNSVILNDNNATNELITGFSINGTNLQISDAGGTYSVDLRDLAGGTLNEAEVDAFVSNNGYLTNEIQDLQLIGNILSLTNINGGTQIDLSAYLDDTNLTESEVDAYVNNNGYLTNEIQDLQLNGHILSITNIIGGTQIDLSAYLDDTNPTESEVDAFVGNNGYLTNEIDGSITNEIQNISTNGNAGNISITNGATLNLNVNDADANATNEIQDLSIASNVLSITNNTAASQINLTPYLDAAFRTTNNVTSNAPGNYATDDFLFGSPQFAYDGNANHFNRMFFDKSKGAFRAGSAPGFEWDDVNVGVNSVALGSGTIASGVRSFSVGWGSVASGDNSLAFIDGEATSPFSIAMGNLAVSSGGNSIAMGTNSVASGAGSVAIGDHSEATGQGSVALGSFPNAFGQNSISVGESWATGLNSVAIGFNATSSGNYATVFGRDVEARSYSETFIGVYGTLVPAISSASFSSLDRLFSIGNGTGPVAQRSDAFIMLKNGNTRLHGQLTIDADNVSGAGGSYTFPGQRGTNGQVMVTNGTGTLSWSTLPSTAFTTATGVTSNASGNYATDDFVFGSSQLADDGNSTHYSRMFFDKSKGAFRAGVESGTDWNDTNVGYNSVAFSGSRASGWTSAAVGHNTQASGETAFSAGTNTIASGDYSVATGISSVASGHTSFAAMGGTASGLSAIAAGSSTLASGGFSSAFGANTVASGNNAFSSGQQTIANAYGQTAIGLYNTAPAADASNYISTDRLFVIGNGTDIGSRSDAFVMLKNGNTTLNGTLSIDADNASGAGASYQLPAQDGINGTFIVTDGSGISSWTNAIPFLTVTNTFTNLSDSRLKKNIHPLTGSLSILSRLHGYQYNWNSSSKQDSTATQTGLIAQEVEKILPELVQTNSEGFKSVNYIGLIPHLIEAIKELKTENEKLKAENEKTISESKSKLDAIETRLAQLEKMMTQSATDSQIAKKD